MKGISNPGNGVEGRVRKTAFRRSHRQTSPRRFAALAGPRLLGLARTPSTVYFQLLGRLSIVSCHCSVKGLNGGSPIARLGTRSGKGMNKKRNRKEISGGKE